MDAVTYQALKYDLDEDLQNHFITQPEYNDELIGLNQERQKQRIELVTETRETQNRECKPKFTFRPFYILNRKLLYKVKRRRCPDLCPPKRYNAGNFKRDFICTLPI